MKRILTKNIIAFCKQMIKRCQEDISRIPSSRNNEADKLIVKNRIKYYEQIISDYEQHKELGKPLGMNTIEFQRFSELPIFSEVTGEIHSPQA